MTSDADLVCEWRGRGSPGPRSFSPSRWPSMDLFTPTLRCR